MLVIILLVIKLPVLVVFMHISKNFRTRWFSASKTHRRSTLRTENSSERAFFNFMPRTVISSAIVQVKLAALNFLSRLSQILLRRCKNSFFVNRAHWIREAGDKVQSHWVQGGPDWRIFHRPLLRSSFPSSCLSVIVIPSVRKFAVRVRQSVSVPKSQSAAGDSFQPLLLNSS